jgi:hypothetical protein
MSLTTLKITVALQLAVGLTAVGLISHAALAEDKPTKTTGSAASRPAKAPTDLSWIDQRVQDWQPTKVERRMDEIGWAKDLRQALSLAKETNRPVFLFTYSGTATEAEAITLQRC